MLLDKELLDNLAETAYLVVGNLQMIERNVWGKNNGTPVIHL